MKIPKKRILVMRSRPARNYKVSIRSSFSAIFVGLSMLSSLMIAGSAKADPTVPIPGILSPADGNNVFGLRNDNSQLGKWTWNGGWTYMSFSGGPAFSMIAPVSTLNVFGLRRDNGHLGDWYWTGSAWGYYDIAGGPAFSAIASATPGNVYGIRLDNGRVGTWYWTQGVGWKYYDLPGGPAFSAMSLVDNNNIFGIRSDNGQLGKWTYVLGTGWGYSDITGGPVFSKIVALDAFHIYGIRKDTGQTGTWYWTGSKWSYYDLGNGPAFSAIAPATNANVYGIRSDNGQLGTWYWTQGVGWGYYDLVGPSFSTIVAASNTQIYGLRKDNGLLGTWYYDLTGSGWHYYDIPGGPAITSTYTDWLVRKICVDSSDRPIPKDPYYGCPSGTTKRSQKMGDPLPYHVTDLLALQRADAWWTYDGKMNPTYFHNFDYAPFGQYQISGKSDGHDSYSIQNGWVSFADTRDGGGYGTTWWGPRCTLGGGWVLFPTSGFVSGGSAVLPYAGMNWEQSGLTAPGTCGSTIDSLTTWELKRNFKFGGVGGQPVKTMDAIVSYHGNPTDDHLEIFYFTQVYGPTRWEAWLPASANPVKGTSCVSPDVITYQGKQWVMTDCHDWTRVTLSAPTDATPPVWPLPFANMLSNWHWDSNWTQSWQAAGSASDGGRMNYEAFASTFSADIGGLFGYVLPGTRYLLTNCGVLSSSSSCGAVEQLWQDLPVSQFISGTNYVYGIDARTMSGSGNLLLALQQLDASKTHVLSQIYTTVTLNSNYDSRTDSAYYNTKFSFGQGKLNIQAGTKYVRYAILLSSPATFKILDAWLFSVPETRSLGIAP